MAIRVADGEVGEQTESLTNTPHPDGFHVIGAMDHVMGDGDIDQGAASRRDRKTGQVIAPVVSGVAGGQIHARQM